MADRGGGVAGGLGGNPTHTFYFILTLALVFTVKDIFLGGGGGMSRSGSESDGPGGSDLRSRGGRLDSGDDDMMGHLPPLEVGGPGSRLSAAKVTSGPSMKFRYW
jgi:hypothetical protein